MDFIRKNRNAFFIIVSFLLGLFIWVSPEPSGVTPQAWHLFAIFVATIVGIVLRPFPMGAIAIFAIVFSVLTKALTFSEAFSGFSNEIVWLVVFAFFIARAFILTGLGSRMAYRIMTIVGKNSLGLGYGLVATDFILAPMIPSLTARVGGVVYPILKALAEVFTGRSHDPKMGSFLTMTAYQGATITSAMFLTAMAGNPLIVALARGQGVNITWGSWALAAIVPGLLSLCLTPYVIFRLSPPTIRKTPHARKMALDKLAEMGPIRPQEWIVLGTFLLLIVLWITGPLLGINATIAAMAGVAILLLSGILKWRDILDESSAWDTFIWFSSLVTLASSLNRLGLSSWFGNWIVAHVAGMEWMIGFIVISLVYFYAHYFFASNVAHIGALYTPLLIVSIALGTPAALATLALAFFSSLFAGLTHYGSGPAPILFGAGYATVGQWWKVGAIVSFCNLIIWLLIGGLWWKFLGFW